MHTNEHAWIFTPEETAEFIEIWAKEFNEYITEDQAVMEMRKLLELYELLIRPLPGEDPNQRIRLV